MGDLIDLVPKKVYAAALAAVLVTCALLGAGLVMSKAQTAGVRTELAQARQQRSDENAARATVVAEHANEVARLQNRHAARQQEIVHEYHDQADRDAAQRSADASDIDVLRSALRTYTAGGGAVSEGDTAACRSAADRSGRLGAALDEALGLQGEAEGFIRQRDREVKLLKGVIANDRALSP